MMETQMLIEILLLCKLMFIFILIPWLQWLIIESKIGILSLDMGARVRNRDHGKLQQHMNYRQDMNDNSW